MNKTLRIFAKDTRHLWPEIVLSLALTLGFAATGHFAWPQYRNDLRESGSLISWNVVLMFLSWWFLIARAVQDEPLVGDRQFWITRPYGWTRVLAAKWLFFLAYIVAPFYVAQCFLLHQAGLHPLAVIPSLLFSAVLFIGFFILPLLALSTVTPGITKMFVILFGLVVYAGVAAYVSSLLATSPPWMPEITHPLAVVIWAIPLCALVVMFVQYARRHTRLSTIVLLGLVALLTTAAMVSAYMPGRLRDFPALAAAERPPVNVHFNPDPGQAFDIATNPNVVKAMKGEGPDGIAEVPLTLSGIAPGHAITFEGETFTVSADGAPTETVAWQRGSYLRYRSGVRFLSYGEAVPAIADSSAAITIPLRFLKEFAGKPVTIHITYAVNELESEAPATAMFNGHTAEIPQNGHCINMGDYAKDSSGLWCGYPLTGPGFTHITWTMQDTCDASASKTEQKDVWIGSTEHGLLEPGINPVVWDSNTVLLKDMIDHPPAVYNLCPNKPLTLTRYHVLRRRLIDVTLPPIDLRLYVPPPAKPKDAPAEFGRDVE